MPNELPYVVVPCTEPWQRLQSDDILNFQYARIGVPYSPVPATRLVVIRDGTVVGSLDLVSDNGSLPIEKAYPVEIANYRYAGLRLMEVSAFATLHLRDGEQKALLLETARRLYEAPIDAALCGVHPEWARGYEVMMGWRLVANPKVLPGTQVPVVLLYLDRAGARRGKIGKRLLRETT